MIVRILGEGQFRVSDADSHSALNSADDTIEAAVTSGDATALAAALQQLHDLLVAHGEPVPDEEIVDSDVIIPGTDASLEEVRAMLSDEGLIPDTHA